MKKYSVYLTKDQESGCFSAKSTDGYGLKLNGLSEADKGKGISPMEMLLAASGGCAGIDIVCLLNNEGIELDSFDINVNGFRNLRETPAYFRSVEMHFIAKGAVAEDKIYECISLSLHKYCTVGRTLEAFADISWSLNLNGVQGTLQQLEIDGLEDDEELLVRAKNNFNSSI